LCNRVDEYFTVTTHQGRSVAAGLARLKTEPASAKPALVRCGGSRLVRRQRTVAAVRAPLCAVRWRGAVRHLASRAAVGAWRAAGARRAAAGRSDGPAVSAAGSHTRPGATAWTARTGARSLTTTSLPVRVTRCKLR
jgi:hypothetical protein